MRTIIFATPDDLSMPDSKRHTPRRLVPSTALAKAVFEAALTHGPHLDFLRRKYEQLIADDWNPDPTYKDR